MTSYYPIPIDFKISEFNDEFVRSSVTLFNKPNNAQLKSIRRIDKKDIFFYYL